MNSYTSTAAFYIATVAGVTNHFNASQITVLNWYINKVINTVGSAGATDYYRTAKVKVGTVTPSLTNDQKIEVLAILEFCNEYAKSFFSGNATTMYNALASKAAGAANGRVQGGCNISFKGVMLSAVVSGAACAVRGAVVGAAGGTVALPLFGTATGAVGGAVFGFAGAFIGGAGLALVEQGLANCLFASRVVTTPPVECYQLSYAKTHIDQCLKEGGDLKLWYHL